MIYAIETSKDLDSIDAELYVANVSDFAKKLVNRRPGVRLAFEG